MPGSLGDGALDMSGKFLLRECTARVAIDRNSGLSTEPQSFRFPFPFFNSVIVVDRGLINSPEWFDEPLAQCSANHFKLPGIGARDEKPFQHIAFPDGHLCARAIKLAPIDHA